MNRRCVPEWESERVHATGIERKRKGCKRIMNGLFYDGDS